jgi:hypothetical protein
VRSVEIKLLDTVALTEDLPARGLRRGQVGTVVHVFPSQDAYEVEFLDGHGRTYVELALKPDQIMVLHYTPA